MADSLIINVNLNDLNCIDLFIFLSSISLLWYKYVWFVHANIMLLLKCGYDTFQGGKVRAKLVTELSSAEGVVIEEGTAGESGKAAAQSGMQK